MTATCAECRYYERIPGPYKQYAHGCWYARHLFVRASNREVPPACHLFSEAYPKQVPESLCDSTEPTGVKA
jgi:hypothetical protein